MMYAIVLTYIRPLDDVNLHVDTHKAWLAANVKRGRVVVAGPLASKTGGLVLAACAGEAELAAMMDEDPFIANGVARYDAYAFTPALAAASFPARWATDARFIRDDGGDAP